MVINGEANIIISQLGGYMYCMFIELRVRLLSAFYKVIPLQHLQH